MAGNAVRVLGFCDIYLYTAFLFATLSVAFLFIIPAFSFVSVAGGGAVAVVFGIPLMYIRFSVVFYMTAWHTTRNYRRALSLPCGRRRYVACQAFDDDVTPSI
jgi:hypothetical protein